MCTKDRDRYITCAIALIGLLFGFAGYMQICYVFAYTEPQAAVPEAIGPEAVTGTT